ncbi:serine-arginine protein 55-like [Harmonia axyridis]|uniref:serine-arginine protein 55-like n=1 Tax=Harmonia axyridis TaxID=115357 RepID=UPI001E278251|nr:serine-arginine protein 55-like [Harmonia axyridis]
MSFSSKGRNSTRVFVGGLTYRVRERDLERFFRKYGRIREVSMKNGFAFVEFEDHRDAEDAVYECNGKDLMGERISVERARGTPKGSDQFRGSDRGSFRGPPRGRPRDSFRRESKGRNIDRYGPPTRTENRLIVENLSSRVSWQDLKDFMRQAGEVTYADAHKQRKNEGVVEFANFSDMKNALEKLQDQEFSGRKIHLIEDKRKSGGGRKLSKSRSRSRTKFRRSRSGSSRRSSRSKSRSPSKGRSPKSKNGSRSRSRSLSEDSGRENNHNDRSISRSPKRDEKD